MRLLSLAFLGLGWVADAHGQAGRHPSTPVESLTARIVAAAALPALAEEIRGAGVPHRDLAGVLAVLGERRVPATDARRILDEEWRAAREHGPVPGLAAFVRGRLDEGLRGEALVAAIRSEHARRGTGGDRVGADPRRQAPAGARAPIPAEKRKARPAGPAGAEDHR